MIRGAGRGGSPRDPAGPGRAEPSRAAADLGETRDRHRERALAQDGQALLAGLGAVRYEPVAFVLAAVALTIALIVTIVGNVPINLWQSRMREDEVPEGFVRTRRRWDVFQAIRGALQLLGFTLVALGTAAL